MPEFGWQQPMARLRQHLGDIVASIEAKASYGAVLLSTAQELRIVVEDREVPMHTGAPKRASMAITRGQQRCVSAGLR